MNNVSFLKIIKIHFFFKKPPIFNQKVVVCIITKTRIFKIYRIFVNFKGFFALIPETKSVLRKRKRKPTVS